MAWYKPKLFLSLDLVMDEYLISVFQSMTFSDIIDISVVATILYASMIWLQGAKMHLEVRGIIILGAFYIIARYLDLLMTAWIFQGFFTVFLIMMIVIFQEEIRHLFQRIGLWTFNLKKTPPLRGEATDIIASTLVDLAKNKTGALIVIRGNDPLEQYITGGIVLNGEVSGPLLKSIFDPHSPGNDGAVVIENDRISRFRAHLPLSKDLVQIAHLGTRHRAALGLAELRDAVCLVVSEERGQVSIAQNGDLAPVEDRQQIVGAITEFLQEKFPPREVKSVLFGVFRKNWVAKAVSVSLAIGFWYIFVPGSKTLEMSYRIPVRVEKVPAHLRVEQIEPSVVNVTFNAPRRAFYLFDSKRLQIAVDVSMLELGRRTFNITEQNIRYPKDLILQDVNPSTIRISVKGEPG